MEVVLDLNVQRLELNCDALGRECLIGEPASWQSAQKLGHNIRHSSRFP